MGKACLLSVKDILPLGVLSRPMKEVPMHKWKKWSSEEVQKLEDIMEMGSKETMGGSLPWSEVALRLGTGRSAKQCRFRWLNSSNSKSDTKIGKWEHLEELIICSEHVIRGPCWARTARLLVSRTENTVKNHWNGIRKSTAMYRPCSVLWHYVRQLANHQESYQAFKAAVEAWCQVVPAELSSAVIQEFKAWQVEKQPGGIALQLPNPHAAATGPSASHVNLEQFKPETRYHPDAIASMNVALMEAVTASMAPSTKAPASPSAPRRTVRSSVATVVKQLHHHQPTAPVAVRQEWMNPTADHIKYPASSASLEATTTPCHNLGHIQMDTTSSAPSYGEAGMQLPQPLQAGRVLMIGNQANTTANTDNIMHLLPIIDQSAPAMHAAALPGSGSTMPVVQMVDLRSQAGVTNGQVCTAFPTHHPPVAAGRICPLGPVEVVDLREPFPMRMIIDGAGYQTATRETAPLMAQPAPAFPTLREIAVPPPEPAGLNWSAPAQVPRTYMAAQPPHFTQLVTGW